jgi:hypothetical protein
VENISSFFFLRRRWIFFPSSFSLRVYINPIQAKSPRNIFLAAAAGRRDVRNFSYFLCLSSFAAATTLLPLHRYSRQVARRTFFSPPPYLTSPRRCCLLMKNVSRKSVSRSNSSPLIALGIFYLKSFALSGLIRNRCGRLGAASTPEQRMQAKLNFYF